MGLKWPWRRTVVPPPTWTVDLLYGKSTAFINTDIGASSISQILQRVGHGQVYRTTQDFDVWFAYHVQGNHKSQYIWPPELSQQDQDYPHNALGVRFIFDTRSDALLTKLAWS